MPRLYSPGASLHDDYAHICDNCGLEDGRATLGWTLEGGRYFDICLPCLLEVAEKHCGEIQCIQREHSELPDKNAHKANIPPELRWAIFERDNFTCLICGSRRFLTIDHIIPESLGGETVMSNLQTLCKSCNSRKGNGISVTNQTEEHGR